MEKLRNFKEIWLFFHFLEELRELRRESSYYWIEVGCGSGGETNKGLAQIKYCSRAILDTLLFLRTSLIPTPSVFLFCPFFSCHWCLIILHQFIKNSLPSNFAMNIKNIFLEEAFNNRDPSKSRKVCMPAVDKINKIKIL